MTSPPDLDDFDPIREIKRLRQDLAHRLRDLQDGNAEGDSEKTADREDRSDNPTEEVTGEETVDSIGHHMRQAKKILAHLQMRTEARHQSVDAGDRSGEKENRLAPEYQNVPVHDAGGRSPEKEPATCSVDKKRPAGFLSRKDERSFQRDLSHFFSLDEKIDAPSEQIDLLKWSQAGLTAFGLFFMVAGAVLCVPLPGDVRHVATVFLLSGALMAGVGLLGRFLEMTLNRIGKTEKSRG